MTVPTNKPRGNFKDVPLRIVSPDFGSPLTDLILALENYRRDKPAMSTPPGIFSEIKSIFHMLESIGSARIEGNNTTIAEYVETKLDKKPDHRESIVEIRNGEEALAFIDANIGSSAINRLFVSEIHKLVVKDLLPPPEGEGSDSPGEFRRREVDIRNSELVVTPVALVPPYVEELLAFLASRGEPKFDLLKLAIAHHRFVWIHPFDNGNGRTVRHFTYATLLKYGFGNPESRLINPVAIFCEDREKYCAALARADKGDDEGILQWCQYMLEGLKRELDKISQLGDYQFLQKNILLPALESALERQILKPIEFEILKIAVEKGSVVNGDITRRYPQKHISAVSRLISDLRDSEMLRSFPENSRRYQITFNNNFLLRDVTKALREKGFCPTKN